MLFIVLLSLNLFIVNCDVNEVYHSEGQLKIAIIFNDCANFTVSSYVQSGIWIIERLNFLNLTNTLRFGLSVFQVCTEYDYYDPVYRIFKEDDYLAALSNKPFPVKIEHFANILGVNLGVTETYTAPLLEAAIKFLTALDVKDNLIVYTDKEILHQDFFQLTKEARICIKDAVIFEKYLRKNKKPNGDVVIVFGKHENIAGLLSNNSFHSDVQTIFAPVDDGFEFIDFPEGSYIIQPNYSDNFPPPLIFDLVGPLMNLAINVTNFINENCNETSYKFNCLHNKFPKYINPRVKYSIVDIENFLKLEEFSDDFVYKIFRVENLTLHDNIFQSFVNILTYNIFNKNLTNLEISSTKNLYFNNTRPKRFFDCINFEQRIPSNRILISYAFSRFELRSESWVFAFLSISLLGLLFSVAILIFLLVRFCKRDILEGNPFLTILLLFSVMLMYLSVIPFALDSDKELKNAICLTRTLSSTLSFAFAFALLLSRSILLATVSKEIGFMSHVPGPVQSFLTLFIFGIQAALSLQFIEHCEAIFRGISFVYLMSYNVILLVLLLFICPLNSRVQRNYKEGKYLTISVVLLALTWSCWIPAYGVLRQEWKDPLLCTGLIMTASILLGGIFIPRTYMMTIAAARDRLTNVLPSLQGTCSFMDVYRASTQPVYDCINVAAINNTTLARNGIPLPPPQPETYSPPATPYEEEFDFERCITPTQDKVTRF